MDEIIDRPLLQINEYDGMLKYTTTKLSAFEILGLSKYLEIISKELIEELNERN